MIEHHAAANGRRGVDVHAEERRGAGLQKERGGPLHASTEALQTENRQLKASLTAAREAEGKSEPKKQPFRKA